MKPATRAHTDTRGALYPAAAARRGHGEAVWERDRDEPFTSIPAGVLSAARAVRAAPRGAGDSRADAPASARPPEEDAPG